MYLKWLGQGTKNQIERKADLNELCFFRYRVKKIPVSCETGICYIV
jgi:hypothetical protein